KEIAPCGPDSPWRNCSSGTVSAGTRTTCHTSPSTRSSPGPTPTTTEPASGHRSIREPSSMPPETRGARWTRHSASGGALPGGSSLAQLLEERRGVRNRANVPDLLPAEVLAWADAHHARTGRWPIRKSGPIPEAPGETWWAVDAAFVAGSRGLVGYGSLVRFL